MVAVIPLFVEQVLAGETARVLAILDRKEGLGRDDYLVALGAKIAQSAAEHLLSRAIERDVGGRGLRQRHRLLLGWVGMRSGRWSAAPSCERSGRASIESCSLRSCWRRSCRC